MYVSITRILESPSIVINIYKEVSPAAVVKSYDLQYLSGCSPCS